MQLRTSSLLIIGLLASTSSQAYVLRAPDIALLQTACQNQTATSVQENGKQQRKLTAAAHVSVRKAVRQAKKGRADKLNSLCASIAPQSGPGTALPPIDPVNLFSGGPATPPSAPLFPPVVPADIQPGAGPHPPSVGLTAQTAGTVALSPQSIGTSAVPVPAAAWLLGSGLFGLALIGRKRSRTGSQS